MIISVGEARTRIDCGTILDNALVGYLEAVESVIRAYTYNNFQQQTVRFAGRSEDHRVYGSPRYFAVGDTVQISASGVNDGLYTITVVNTDYIELDKPLMAIPYNLVTKIKYPADVVQCALDLCAWKLSKGDKVGIKSETLSRHSVTYEDSATLYMGYPVGILNGLNLYRKARC